MVTLSYCPACKKLGRVLIVKGRLTNRRICDSCRDMLWDVNGEVNQFLLPIEEEKVNQ